MSCDDTAVNSYSNHPSPCAHRRMYFEPILLAAGADAADVDADLNTNARCHESTEQQWYTG